MDWLVLTICFCLFLLLVFLLKKLFFARHYILLTGSASSDYVRTFLNEKYKISYEPASNEYKLNSSTRLIVSCELNRAAFDSKSFELKYNEIKAGLKQIVCIENLNPRPETLEADLNVLGKVVSPQELKKYLHIVFKSSSQNDLDLSEIRKSSENFHVLFAALGLKSKADIDKYIRKRIWTEKSFKNDRFKGTLLFFKIITIALIILGCVFGLPAVQKQANKFEYEYSYFYDKMVNITFEYLCSQDKVIQVNVPVCEQNFTNATIESNSAALAPIELPKISRIITENLLTIVENVTNITFVKEYKDRKEIETIVETTRVVKNVTKTINLNKTIETIYKRN